jgi:hypothetical protein
MNNTEQILKSELSELMTDVEPSSIPLTKEVPALPDKPIDINMVSQTMWSNKSNQLLNDYKYGENLARYGENEISNKAFFKRLSTSLCAIISNEFQKRGIGSEALKPHYNILESCLSLIARDIDKAELKEQDTYAIIASLQGFITNYNQKKKG